MLNSVVFTSDWAQLHHHPPQVHLWKFWRTWATDNLYSEYYLNSLRKRFARARSKLGRFSRNFRTVPFKNFSFEGSRTEQNGLRSPNGTNGHEQSTDGHERSTNGHEQ